MKARWKFNLHIAAAFLLVALPMFGLHWWLGIITLIACILAIEIVHGLFDDFIGALTPGAQDGR